MLLTRNNAPWGLARINQDVRLSGSKDDTNYLYIYDSSAGAGVDVYILGTHPGRMDVLIDSSAPL